MLFLSMGWADVSKLWLPLGLFFTPQFIYVNREQWWNDTDRWNWRTCRKACPSVAFPYHFFFFLLLTLSVSPFPHFARCYLLWLGEFLAVWGLWTRKTGAVRWTSSKKVNCPCFFGLLNYHAWISALKHRVTPVLDFGAWAIFSMFEHW
jgi:hypothetical protein